MKERGLPEGWEWRRLGDVAQINMGQSPPGSSYNQSGEGVPFLQGNADFGDFSPDYKSWTTQPLKYATKGSILLSVRAPIGAINFADIDYCIGRGLSSLSMIDGNNGYLFYLLKYLKPELEDKGTGSTFKAISKSTLNELVVPIPPLPTQRKIVAILERAEHLQRLRGEADALTQQLMQSVFLEMFGDPVTNPMGWEVKKLKDISDIVSGVTKGRQFNGKSTVNAPYLRVANVQDGYLNLSEIKEIEVLESDVEKYALLEGDVLLTEGGDRDKLGRGAVWHCEISPCIHQNHIFRVRPNRDLILPDYLSMLIGSNHGKNYFLKSAKQTTGIASINSTQLKNFPVYLPPLFLQACFADIVQKTSILSKKQSHSLNEVTSMFDSLMSRAFTGDLIA